MSDTRGIAIFGPETAFKGRIRNARVVRIDGYVEGHIAAQHLEVGRNGRFFGTVNAGTADVAGVVQGEVHAKTLIRISETGSVHGTVQYGAIELAPGGELSAEMRNIPPAIAGDMTLSVHRGRSVIITPGDLQAVDPDDVPQDLVFEATQFANGYVALTNAPSQPCQTFSQADLNAGQVLFVHDGSHGENASFQVQVRDSSGASSGAPEAVQVHVRDLGQRPRG